MCRKGSLHMAWGMERDDARIDIIEQDIGSKESGSGPRSP